MGPDTCPNDPPNIFSRTDIGWAPTLRAEAALPASLKSPAIAQATQFMVPRSGFAIALPPATTSSAALVAPSAPAVWPTAPDRRVSSAAMPSSTSSPAPSDGNGGDKAEASQRAGGETRFADAGLRKRRRRRQIDHPERLRASRTPAPLLLGRGRSDAQDALIPQWLPMGRITADTEVDP
jgi:hypothetical protein